MQISYVTAQSVRTVDNMAEINVDKEGSTSSTDQVETSGSSNKDKYPELFYSHGMDCRMYQGEKMRGTIKTM